jgi:hypothetical protein
LWENRPYGGALKEKNSLEGKESSLTTYHYLMILGTYLITILGLFDAVGVFNFVGRAYLGLDQKNAEPLDPLFFFSTSTLVNRVT